MLPADLQDLLLTFVPEPPPLTVNASDDLPARVRRPHKDLGSYYHKPDEKEVDLQVRPTARAALHDVKALLRLVDAGEVRVSDKTRRPSQATIKAIRGVLTEGEFYEDADQSKYEWDPASDLVIKAFAWPMLLQAAGLAQLAGARLQLSPAGRKATNKPAHEVIRLVWDKWLKTSLLDEFNRISVVKGQQGKGRGGLTAVAPRRQSVVAVICNIPPPADMELARKAQDASTSLHTTCGRAPRPTFFATHARCRETPGRRKTVLPGDGPFFRKIETRD